jgi:hypothetical protein
MPEHLEPKSTKRSLAISVRMYFYALYNAANGTFKDLLASVGNKDAITGNRLFDRHDAVGMIKDTAKKADDSIVQNAKDGDIYKVLVNILRYEGMGLKIRRQEYQRLTHQAPAE